MPQLSQEQQELKTAIAKSAMIWAGFFGLVVAGILYFALGGLESGNRILLAVLGGLVTFGGIFFWRKSANSAAAKCPKCNATFSITRIDRVEVLASSENKETRESQDDGSVKVITWIEEVFDVTDTYACSQCNDETTKQYKTNRKKDETETIEPAKVEEVLENASKVSMAKSDPNVKSAQKKASPELKSKK